MTFTDAGALFTKLTIGDGLVSQIPALLIAITAGLIVTRVASEEENQHLGKDIAMQLLAQYYFELDNQLESTYMDAHKLVDLVFPLKTS